MDKMALNVVISISSAVMMLAAIIYILTYLLGFFSSESGAMPLRVVLFSLLYFFGSTIPIYMSVEWLNGLSRIPTSTGGSPLCLNIGASALALTAVLHTFCGVLTAFLYLKGKISQDKLCAHYSRKRVARNIYFQS